MAWLYWVGLAVTYAAPIRVALKQGQEGLFVAPVSVGTPPQQLWLQLDTGSAWSWIPAGNSTGFNLSESSSATLGEEKSLSFADGDTVNGHLLTDQLVLGDLQVRAMLVLGNTSQGEGLLGLVSKQKASASWLRGLLTEEEEAHSVLTALWAAHPEVPKTYRLDLGLPSPQLLLGVPSSDTALEGPSETTFLGPTLTRKASNWYVSVRAIGLSYGQESPTLRTSIDFNSFVPMGDLGAAGLLDSGAAAIRVGVGVWERIMLGMPNSCRQGPSGEINCPCKEELPTISLSLETMATFRILGLDSGADIIVCIPPSAYVTQSKEDGRCDLAIVNAGEHHTALQREAVVLGLPFFRSMSVVFDVDQRVVGIEPVPRTGSQACCDPKNWWSTGRRFSLRRVIVALLIVGMISAYVFVGFSQSRTAERLRALLETILGPVFSSSSDDRHTQFLQMANRNTE